MSKDKISDYSTTANSNTDIGGINVDEGCAPSGINDAIRTLMAQLKTWQSGGQDVYIHPAGSASAPSITANGDTNTGIFFPAADTVGITTGGTERARVDSSGNLGLGTTPSSWGSSFRALQVTNASALWSATSGDLQLANNAYYDGTNYKFVYGSGSAYAAQYQQKDGKHIWQTAGSGTAGGTITFTQAMTLDASGNLQLGTTSAILGSSSLRELVLSNASANIINLAIGSTSTAFFYTSATQANIGTIANIPFTLHTNNTERARIDSSGNLLVGTASTLSNTAAHLQVLGVSTDDSLAVFKNGSGRSAGNILFQNASGTQVGYIQIQASATAYVTSSDYRLKNTVAPMTGALAKVAALNPVTYKWNSDNSDGEGFIAHELAEVCPHAVVGEKDAVDADGNPQYQGIDTSFLVATLTAAIQELKATVDAQAARITALEQA